MKKTTITVEAAKSKNYQTYKVGLQMEIEYSDNEELLAKIEEAQAICRKQVIKQIGLDSI